MSLLPVLDLMRGQIVRGIAGRRASYQPIVSRLVNSSEPLAIARAFQQHYGYTKFYLADLDALQGGLPALEVMARLLHEGYQLWVDAGIRSADDTMLAVLLQIKAAGIIIGLESVSDPLELQRIVLQAGEHVIFSLDLKSGQPLGHKDRWHTEDAWAIAQRAIADLGIRRLIVLDLARVGVGAGTGTESLCARIRRSFPSVEITAGGGVRDGGDVRRLYDHGVDHVLVASALHDGRIMPEEARGY